MLCFCSLTLCQKEALGSARAYLSGDSLRSALLLFLLTLTGGHTSI